MKTKAIVFTGPFQIEIKDLIRWGEKSLPLFLLMRV